SDWPSSMVTLLSRSTGRNMHWVRRFRCTFTFSHLADAFYPKRLTRMYTHLTFTLMGHCTSGAIRGSVSCSRTLRQGIELATFRLLNDFSTLLLYHRSA